MDSIDEYDWVPVEQPPLKSLELCWVESNDAKPREVVARMFGLSEDLLTHLETAHDYPRTTNRN